MKKVMTVVFALIGLLIPLSAYAQLDPQFGKNKVVWERTDKNFYQSAHFDVYHSLDLSDPNQKYHLEEAVRQLEGSYDYLSSRLKYSLRSRIPIILNRTHSVLEGSNVSNDPFLSEGIGAFAEPTRNRMVLKLDFLPPLNNTIITHELGHIFYFDMARQGLLSRIGSSPRPGFFVEGSSAEFMANSYSPYTRDDIRTMIVRGIASNPEMYLPTWEMMETGNCGATQECNPYIAGEMVSEFINDEFGEDAATNFIIMGYRNSKRSLLGIIREVTGGKIATVAKFNQSHMDYWAKRYASEMLDKQRPYQDTDNFKGRSISPVRVPYPMFSPALSADGKKVSCFTIGAGGVIIVSFPIPVGDQVDIDRADIEERDNTGRIDEVKKAEQEKREKIKVLTKYTPPKPFEYLVSQGLVTWPFNGSDQDWSRHGDKIAFFAEKNRDHTLVIIDAEKGKTLKQYELPLDQAFSPAWSPDEKKIYFSASKNVTRDIYEIDLETGTVTNLTNDLPFDTAPVVSPDGMKMVYVSFVGDFQKLFMLDLATGTKKQLTFNRFNDSSPSFSDDGKMIVYTADEHISKGKNGKVWNLYTMDLETQTVSQWTDFFGGVFTPKFARGSTDTIYYVAYWQYDKFRGYTYPNFKLYEAVLKTPIRQRIVKDENESYDFTFKTSDLLSMKLDRNQLLNPQKSPKNWRYYGSNNYIGYSTGSYFGGLFSGGGFMVSDILEDQNYFFRFFSYGSGFKTLDYGYLNQTKRMNWGYGVSYQEMPLKYSYWIPSGKYPQQDILNNTQAKQIGVDLFAQYPFDKFSRVETAYRVKYKSFYNYYGLDSKSFPEFADYFTDQDRGLLNVLESSKGSSTSVLAAYVRDTVIYSGASQGPFKGSAVRVQGESTVPMPGNLVDYKTFSANGRKYFGLTKGGGTLFAVRGDASLSTKRSGEFVVMGGPYSLRGYSYWSLIGNRVLYTSAELRIPLVDAVVFPGRIAFGPIRSLLFADLGKAEFTNESIPAQKGRSLGTVIQFLETPIGLPMNWSVAWTDVDGFKKRRVDFYVNLNW